MTDNFPALAPWLASPEELASVKPYPGEYLATVIFCRSLGDDEDAISPAPLTSAALGVQLAQEIQSAYDNFGDLAGRFQVASVGLPMVQAVPPPLEALAWMLTLCAERFTENADGADPASERSELRDLIHAIDWAEGAGMSAEQVAECRGCLPNDDLARKILSWEPPPPPEPLPLRALRAAEAFLAGFEDDVTQESLPGTLADVRAAIHALEA